MAQSTPDHDALLCECTSKEGIEHIIWQSIREAVWPMMVEVAPRDIYEFLHELYNTTRDHEVCEKLRGTKLCEKLGNKIWLQDHLYHDINVDYNYEVEKLVKKQDVLQIGYADLIITYSIEIKPYILVENAQKEDIVRIKLFSNFVVHEKGTILVELKPDIYDIGAVLRQVKTYRDYLPNITSTVITTFSEVSDDIQQLAKNEDVIIVTFEGEIKEDSQKGKISPKQASIMSQQPATEKQLEFLRKLGYTGEAHNKLEASAIIGELLKKKQQRE